MKLYTSIFLMVFFHFCTNSLFGGTVTLQLSSKDVIDCSLWNYGFYSYCYGSYPAVNITYYNTNGAWERYYSRIPIPAFLYGMSITEATFSIYEISYIGSNDFQTTVNRLTTQLPSAYGSFVGTVEEDPQFDNSLNYDTVSQSAGYTGWLNFRVTDLVNGWINGEFPNDGFVVRMLNENSSTYAVIVISQSEYGESAKRPILRITGPSLPDTTIVELPSDITQPNQWVNTNSPWDISSFTASGSNLFAGRFSDGGGALLSTDNGSSWNVINSGMPVPSYVYSFALNGDSLYAGTYNNGVFLTTDNGSSWKAVNQGLTTQKVRSLAVSGSNLFAGTDGGGVFLSTNGGAGWAQANTGLTDTTVLCLLVNGTNLFAGTLLNGVFRSTNNGTTWTAANSGLPVSPVLALAVKNNNLFAGTSSEGAYISTNNGLSWMSIPPVAGLSEVIGFAVVDTVLFAGVRGNGVYLTMNNGSTWSDVNLGLGNYSINAIYATDTYLYVGTDMGVWRRPISEMITNVKDKSNQVSSHSVLHQNYPNPFNPTTNISFNLQSKSFVSLKVLDMLGREVATIVSEEMPAGSYTKKWNAANMSSGVYFYRLQAGSFTQTKKLVLLR